MARGSTDSALRTLGRWSLGCFLAATGLLHLTAGREEFRAQVPSWMPIDADLVVVGSGIVEIGLGLALLAPVRPRRRHLIGWLTGAFLVAIFPGNIAQYVEGTDSFGLDTDRARLIRLFFQPLLVAWALWSTGAWRAWRGRSRARDGSPTF